MANGFEIKISEADFKSKPIQDQNWILFQGIVAHSKCLDLINGEGCDFGKQGHGKSEKKERSLLLDLARTFGGAIGGALVAGYAIWQAFCGK